MSNSPYSLRLIVIDSHFSIWDRFLHFVENSIPKFICIELGLAEKVPAGNICNQDRVVNNLDQDTIDACGKHKNRVDMTLCFVEIGIYSKSMEIIV